jgi:hypothetical protein
MNNSISISYISLGMRGLGEVYTIWRCVFFDEAVWLCATGCLLVVVTYLLLYVIAGLSNGYGNTGIPCYASYRFVYVIFVSGGRISRVP